MFEKKCLLVFLIITNVYSVRAQDSLSKLTEITSEKESLEEGISLMEESLKDLASLDPISEYELLELFIEKKEELFEILKEQNIILQSDLELNRQAILDLDIEIGIKKKEYQFVLRSLYRKKLVQNEWLYLLSTESLKEAWLRIRYIRQLQQYVQKEKSILEQLRGTKEATNQKINSHLLQIKHNKNQLERSILELKEEGERKAKAVSKIRRDKEAAKEKFLSRQNKNQISKNTITKNQKDQFSLNTPPDESRPLDKKENNSFLAIKGNMSFPVQKGVIVEKFGRRPHDIVPNVWIENNGVGIMTEQGANVKAVFKGVVNETPKISDEGYMIIIAHGDYLTSYFTLASTFVKKGDFVNEGQIIGTISKSSTLSPILHFEIWRGFEKENPSNWLKKK